MYDTTLSQKYAKDMGLYKKKNKMMHTQRRYATCLGMSKKKKEKKRQPLIQKEKKERDGAYKGVHTPSTKNIHTLAHLDKAL